MNLMKLKGARVEKGLTQIEIAKKLGISETSYVQKENGKGKFNVDELVKLSEILEVPIENFLKTN